MKNALDKFISGLNFIFGIVGIIMVFIATYAVLARNVLIVSTPWSDELLKLLFCMVHLCWIAILFMNDGLISLTLVEDGYKEKKPVVYGVLKAIQYIAAIGICGLGYFPAVYHRWYSDEHRRGYHRSKIPAVGNEPWNASWTCPDCNPRSRKTDWFKRIFCEEGSIRDEKIY